MHRKTVMGDADAVIVENIKNPKPIARIWVAHSTKFRLSIFILILFRQKELSCCALTQQQQRPSLSISIMSSSTTPLHYCTLQAFVGDVAAQQLSFAQGELILVQPTATASSSQGWAFGMLVRTGQTGWFPISFVERVQWNDTVNSTATMMAPTEAAPQLTLPEQQQLPSNSNIAELPVAVAIPIHDTPTSDSSNDNFTTTTSRSRDSPGVWLSEESSSPEPPAIPTAESSLDNNNPPNKEDNKSSSSSFFAPSSSSSKSFRKSMRQSVQDVRQQSRRNIAWAASSVSSGLTQAGSFFEKGLAQSPTLQKSGVFGGNSKASSSDNTPTASSADRSKTVTTTTERQGSWLPFSGNSSTTTTTTIAAPDRTTQVQTTRARDGGWSLFGGSSSSTTTTTTTTTTRTHVHEPPQTTKNCSSSNTTAAERLAGSIGTGAAVSSAMNALRGNVRGALRAGTVSAAALAVQGHLAANSTKK